MGEDKTVDQLEAEYKQLLLEKLDAAKQEKIAQELAATEAKKKAEYEEEFKKKYNLTAVSRLEQEPDKQPVNMTANVREFEQFRDGFAKHKGLKRVTGRRYEDVIQEMQNNKGMMTE